MENTTRTHHFIYEIPYNGITSRVSEENGGYVALSIGCEITLFIHEPDIVNEIATALIYANKEFKEIRQENQ